MEAANPDQVAGGAHVFSPLVAAPPPPDDEDDDEAEAESGVTSTTNSVAVLVAPNATAILIGPDHMEVDTSASATTSGIETGSATLLSTAPVSGRSKKRPSSTDVRPPPSKKSTSSSSRISSHVDTTSHASTSGVKAGSVPSVKVMINSMDNTIHSIMDTVKDGMISDRAKAIAAIQHDFVDIGLNDPNRLDGGDILLMINVFTHHLNLAESYIALDKPIRRAWVEDILSHIRRKILEGMSSRRAVHSLSLDQD